MSANDKKSNPFSKFQEKLEEIEQKKCLGSNSNNTKFCDELGEMIDKTNNVSNDYTNRLTLTDRDTANNIADKKTTIRIFEEKTKNLEDHIKNIKQEKENKTRIVEASEWEYDRYNSHISIFKYIFFGLVIINILLFVKSKVSMIPNSIYLILIVFVFAVMVYNIFIEVMYNLRRNKFDYDKFDQSYDQRFDTNSGGTGIPPKSKNGSIFKNLICESFISGEEDRLNGSNYSFIH